MKLIGTVHTFNTGRMYAADGQRIVWAIIERPDGSRCVAFLDLARGINQVVPLHVGNLDLLTDRWVLVAYDDFHYTHGYEECEFLRTAYRATL